MYGIRSLVSSISKDVVLKILNKENIKRNKIGKSHERKFKENDWLL